MRLHVDKEADALYLRLDESEIVESEEVSPGVVLDYNESDEVVGSGVTIPLEAVFGVESVGVAFRDAVIPVLPQNLWRSGVGEEVAGLDVEGVGYLEGGFDGEVLPAVFYQADVGPFQAGGVGEFLLGHSPGCPRGVYSAA